MQCQGFGGILKTGSDDMEIAPVNFENIDIRRVYDEKTETWYFSVVDIIRALLQQPDFQAARNYWKVLKNRLSKEGSDGGRAGCSLELGGPRRVGGCSCVEGVCVKCGGDWQGDLMASAAGEGGGGGDGAGIDRGDGDGAGGVGHDEGGRSRRRGS